MNKQMGISLSEVLISLFLSSLIITALMQFYMSSKQHYLDAETMLTARFDLRWVSDLLSDSIRRAGFTPCLGIEKLNLKKQGRVVHGFLIDNGPKQLLQVNRMHERFAKIIKTLSTTQILVPHATSLNKKRPLLIADCEHAELQHIFDIKPHTDGVLITLDKPLQFIYSGAVYVGEYLEERWFIKNNFRGEPALFYQVNQPEEITPLIHSLHSRSQLEHGKVFIKVVLGLAEEDTRTIRVAVRGS